MADPPTHVDFVGERILRILFIPTGCNNSCTFCMVSNFIEINEKSNLSQIRAEQTELFEALIDELPSESAVDFFGAEPTLHKGFTGLLQRAVSKGLNCSLATNGRIFSSPKYTQKIAEISSGRLYVRTTLLGPNATIHDEHTRATGSFDQLMNGLKNLNSMKIQVQVNIVLTCFNISYLDRMLALLCTHNLSAIKLSALIDTNINDSHLVSFDELREAATIFADYCQSANIEFRFEKMPLCIAPSHMNRFVYEQAIIANNNVFDDGPNGECSNCIVRSVCYGVEQHALARFGVKSLRPIRTVEEKLLTGFDAILAGEANPGHYRITFCRVNEEQLTREQGLRLLNFKNSCHEQIGDLLVEWI